MSRFRIVTALLLSGALSYAVAARAQEDAPPPDGDHKHMEHMDFAAMHRRMCTDHMAHKAGRLGYLSAKLNLTSSQRPLWDSYAQAVMASAKTEEQACLQEPAWNPSARPTVLEHRSREVKMLQAKLQEIQYEDPYLAKLYQSLSTEQKSVMDEGEHGRHHMKGGWGDHHMMEGHEHGPM